MILRGGFTILRRMRFARGRRLLGRWRRRWWWDRGPGGLTSER